MSHQARVLTALLEFICRKKIPTITEKAKYRRNGTFLDHFYIGIIISEWWNIITTNNIGLGVLGNGIERSRSL